MENDLFKINLKSKEDGEELTIITSLLSEMNGLFHFPIELDKWEILSCHQTTGFKDIHNKHIFYSDSVRMKGNDSEYEIIMNDFTKLPVVDGDSGQMELHRCYRNVEVIQPLNQF